MKIAKRIGFGAAIVTNLLFMLGCQPLFMSPQDALSSANIQFATYTPTAIVQPLDSPITVTFTATPALATPSLPLKTITPPATMSPSATITTTTPVHIIVEGDTLLGLAIRYDLPLADIEAANPDLEPTNLQLGQAVRIPLDEGQSSAEATPLLAATVELQPDNGTTPDYVAMEDDMQRLVNQQRTSRNIAVLVLDAELRTVARGHATDMAERNYFDHVTPEGITLRDRLQRAGIVKNWVGENIQVNTLPPDQAAAEAMHWFLDSQPHLDNILAEPFTRLGVGVAEGPPGWYIFVLVFAGET